ncbi:hypothetical protein ACFSYE_06745 [Roseibacillus ishigakijimensis]
MPYLRPLDENDLPIGDPITGTPLTVNYRPSWPEQTPVLHFAETLTLPKSGLPQVRGQSSTEILYQQSIASDFAAQQPSVSLYDPTAQRTAPLSPTGLSSLPGSVATTIYGGRSYFQGLPSHLQERLFYDSAVGELGALVFIGEFFDEPAGEDYLLPNVLTPADIETIDNLCSESDPLRAEWETAIRSLAFEFLVTLPDGQGSTTELRDTFPFLQSHGLEAFLGLLMEGIIGAGTPPTAPKEILSPNQAVDSYALSATGGGSGYVVLLTGNGSAYTPEEEPVAMHIFRVGEELYQGELKPLTAANPLSENVTVQFTGDFAGRPDYFEFQWMKSPPLNGQPPAVYTFTNELFPLPDSLEFAIDDNNGPNDSPAQWDDRVDGNQASHPVGDATYTLLELATSGSDLPPLNLGAETPRQRLRASVDFSSLLDENSEFADLYVSIKKDDLDGLALSLDGSEPVIRFGNPDQIDTETVSPPSDLAVPLIGEEGFSLFRVPGKLLNPDSPTELAFIHTGPHSDSEGARRLVFEVRLGLTIRTTHVEDNFVSVGLPEVGKNRHLVSGAGVETLSDNYYVMRYRPIEGHSLYPAGGYTEEHPGWSDWTSPVLVEGWIKRVLAGINPFNQRISDFYQNAIDSDVSLLTQAGTRWEGDIALNLDAVQDAGLIEIYETVLKRGMSLSIDGTPSIDYGPANDALLLAAGYLNDLYMALGNEAYADALNPTVSYDAQNIGTIAEPALAAGFEETFRNTATARFAFQGQVPSLLEEELGLLRGRDDFLAPGVQTRPAYNRLYWNYTRGIDAGEVIYALNYNIHEQDDDNSDGRVDAVDAQHMFPQAHGDAYGHYLSALKNYYRLLEDTEFTWGTRVEAVNILGQPVTVDYLDERKFAAAAVATVRTSDQILSLERRRAFQNPTAGWENLADGRENSNTGRTRHWGAADWASRGGQGAYFHWVVGNAILPEEDTVNEGVQKIDRTTVAELNELAALGNKIQRQIDSANRKQNPLDLAEDSLLFDISPDELAEGKTHFEQIYDRAVRALGNANTVFERASASTHLLRSLENQQVNLGQTIADEERAYVNELIALYGMPYPSDIGPGKTYAQGYEGPDLYHFNKISRPYEVFTKEQLFAFPDSGENGNATETFSLMVKDDGLINTLENPLIVNSIIDIDLSEIEALGLSQLGLIEIGPGSVLINPYLTEVSNLDGASETSRTVNYTVQESTGPYQLVSASDGSRPANGTIQEQLNAVRLAEEQFYIALWDMQEDRKFFLASMQDVRKDLENKIADRKLDSTLVFEQLAYKLIVPGLEYIKKKFVTVERTIDESFLAVRLAFPESVGVSPDITSAARAAALASAITTKIPTTFGEDAMDMALTALEKAHEQFEIFIENEKTLLERDDALRELITDMLNQYREVLARIYEVDAAYVEYRRAVEGYNTLVADGETILRLRETFRKRAAATVQGYRTRDVAFRAFRTEALDEYQTLLDWASRYTFLAAQAYDYETGLLGSAEGKEYLGDIIASRALGIVGENGQPTFGGSSAGDPGLSGLLARMKADWEVVEGRLGFNNPETYGTTVSLRREFFRIPDGPEGDVAWRQLLESLVLDDLAFDSDIATHALQVNQETLGAQAGIVLSFPTTIEEGRNLFGHPLAAGDHNFTVTNFATKISSVGVVLEGYQGMDPCLICQSGSGDPSHNHDDALSSTPHVFLLPTGVDLMRAPPLGDTRDFRRWMVHDHALPLPFNIGANDFNEGEYYRNGESLTEEFRIPRRHNAFRAVNREDYFYTPLAADYTSSRLVGRSVWNTQWKLVIPALELLSEEDEGLARFINSVTDIKLHFRTYSYAGN